MEWTRATSALRLFGGRWAVGAACFTAVFLLFATASAQAAFPGANGRIAFASERDCEGAESAERFGAPICIAPNKEIYSMNPDGSDPQRLTDSPGDDDFPAWSADGAKIAFESVRCLPEEKECDGDKDIWVMDADGSNPTHIDTDPADCGELLEPDCPDDRNPAWSPDGNKIVFEANPDDGQRRLYIVDLGTGDVTGPLGNLGGNMDLNPAWSPNGLTIAFHRQVPGGSGGRNVFLVDVATNAVTGPLANMPDASMEFDDEPNWSPDGVDIAFMSRQRVEDNVDLFRMSGQGSDIVRLTGQECDPKEDVCDSERNPAWSPDDTRMAFWRENGEEEENSKEIWTMNATDGGSQVQLTNNEVVDENPDWQPIPPPETTAAPPQAQPQPEQQVAPVTGTSPRVRPTLRVAGVRRACVRTSFRVRIRASASGARVRSVTVSLDGRRLRTVRRSRSTITINVRRLRAGRHRLRFVALDSAGNRRIVNRSFVRCAERAQRRAAPRFTG